MRVCAWLIPILSLLALNTATAVSLYSIGNSLTNDMYPDGLQALAQDSGLTLASGFHIRSSASMTYMVANPADVTLSRPTTLDRALVEQAFDFVSVEPYNGLGTPTYASERDAIVAVIERVLQANLGHGIFYLYSAWPNLAETVGNFDTYWRQSMRVEANSQPVQARVFYDALLDDLRTYFGNRATLRVIPIGDVFARIDRDAKAGLIVGVTDMNDLYRDQVHMGEVGRFVAASTVIATLFQQHPAAGASLDLYQFNDGRAQLTPALAAQLEDIIWSVVSDDERTGAIISSSSSSSSSSNNGSSSSDAGSSSTIATGSSGTGSIDAILLALLIGLGGCRRLPL